MATKKNPVSDYLADIGRRGGQAKVPKGLAKLSDAERKEIAAKGLATRRKNAKQKAVKASSKKKSEGSPLHQ